MTGIALFTVPKPFVGHIGTIQRNALRSWVRLGREVEVILFGDERGVAEVAREFNATHIPGIAVNELGTPLLSWAFDRAPLFSSRSYLCYVNSDIILLPDLIKAVNCVKLRSFLLLGQRWDLDIAEEMDFSGLDTDTRLRTMVREKGTIHPPAGSDYFLFPRQISWGLPDFAVGRPSWDNWLIYRARSMRLPVIDATRAVTVIHQNHDYGHVVSDLNQAWEGPEATVNRKLASDMRRVFTLEDATYMLSEGALKRSRIKTARRRLSAARRVLRAQSRRVLH